MDTKIDIEAFKYALSQNIEGFVFEKFAQQFLAIVLSDEFIPVGGKKDKGIDAFRHVFKRNIYEKYIYQISTELSTEQKISDSIETLQKNDIKADRFFYVTNRNVTGKDGIEDSFFETYKIPLTIYDINWFALNVVNDPATVKLYHTFIESHLHEFNQPSKTIVIGSFDKDPRLFVFLRQQLDEYGGKFEIEDILADSLILYSLEGTSSAEGKFKTKEELKSEISKYVTFDPKELWVNIDKRLKILSEKPLRKIKHHKKDGFYCLPHETVIEIIERNLREQKLFNDFFHQTEQLLKDYLSELNLQARNLVDLIEDTIHSIYYNQGLEFSDFVLNKQNYDLVEISLPDVVSKIVDDSSVVIKNKELVKKALLMTIREIIYNGTIEQKQYIQKLSRTYMMMFLLQWDPKLVLYFKSLASKLNVYVGTSILVPALSEIYLDAQNRRHWNLLKGANLAGVKLLVNEIIIDELVRHFQWVKYQYRKMYRDIEHIYLDSEIETLYVDEIMIRAYLYAKMRKQVDNFNEFLNNYVDSDLSSAREDIIEFLKIEFGITYDTSVSTKIQIDETEYELLKNNLYELRKSKELAERDARLMLMIYKIRETNNEISSTEMFGYKTWWFVYTG